MPVCENSIQFRSAVKAPATSSRGGTNLEGTFASWSSSTCALCQGTRADGAAEDWRLTNQERDVSRQGWNAPCKQGSRRPANP